MSIETRVFLSRPSIATLRLEPMGRAKSWGATGFLTERMGKLWLVTNWHVLSGRHFQTGKPLDETDCATPVSITVHFPTAYDISVRVSRNYPVLDEDGDPLWLEHPVHRHAVDVAVMEIEIPDTAARQIYSLDPSPQPAAMRVSEDLSIVGFPFKQMGGAMTALWTRATVASEPVVDYAGLPCFLVDARSRSGQSGSPVLLYRPEGTWMVAENGDPVTYNEPFEEFVGIYSGRINEESDLGFVWRRSVIEEVIGRGVVGEV
ncbi:MAG: trypsin-like peptidase domain-containing protein [Actinomycetota bacterium]|nr:trypsin-like peptidase domain-containing protein [Actinomycetota bacterium]